MHNIIVSDICDTLYYSNTTFDFIKYCVETKRIKKNAWLFQGIINKRNLLFWTAAIIQKAVKVDMPKKIAVRLLKDYKITEVDQWANDFYNEFLEPRKIIEVHKLINNLEKEDLVLASSTIEPVARMIGKKLQIPVVISTSLGIKNGRYTGTIADEISGLKVQALTNYFGQAIPKIRCAISDNYTDRNLIDLAKSKYAVCYSEKDKAYWAQLKNMNLISVQKPQFR